ncbi:MAG: SIS domain-containing protein [Synergistaceae bacterium]|jgi:D-sedoheptulose 7-phosphate isomerase|nr:SIS domain-containing protein [Synergistaceae bacterium]
MLKVVLFDIDGVITDGRITIDENGNEQKQLNLRDIDAIYEIKRRGYRIGAITGEKTNITKYFEKRFPWDHFYRGCKDKISAIQKIERAEGVERDEICYVGDGKYDIEPVRYAGLGVCPADAINPVRECAGLVLGTSGSGTLWELVEYLEEMNSATELVFFKKVYDEHMETFKAVFADSDLQKTVIALGDRIEEAIRNGKKLLLFGNGGSAADAQHIAAEFVGRMYRDRRAIDAEALSVNTSSITAIGNDYDFESIFARQVEARGESGDILLGISTSGTSKNVLNALEFGHSHDMATALFTGRRVRAYPFVDAEINVPSDLTPRIQEAHIFLGHLICEYVEEKLFKVVE